MNNLPYLIFDDNAVLKIVHGIAIPDVHSAFLYSMRSGDRIIFDEFCRRGFDPESTDFKLFKLNKFGSYSYSFLEKNTFCGEVVNVVYFAQAFNEFHQLMSPSSHYYRSFTGRLIYELLYMSYEKLAEAPHLTPSAFLALDNIPHLRDELLKNPRIPEFCSLRTVTECIAKHICGRKELSMLKLETVLGDGSDEMTDFSIPAYIYLFTSLIYIFMSLSADRTVRIELKHATDHEEVMFCSKIMKSCRITDEAGSLAELAELVPSMDRLAKVAAVVAYDSNISTAINFDSETMTLRVSASISGTREAEATFHYRDPYSNIPEIFEEFAQFINTLMENAA